MCSNAVCLQIDMTDSIMQHQEGKGPQATSAIDWKIRTTLQVSCKGDEKAEEFNAPSQILYKNIHVTQKQVVPHHEEQQVLTAKYIILSDP